MINRNHLALFHAVAEEGGFGRGAQRLRISQPAVSLQIAQLESILGLRLFDRVGRSVRLTQAGEELAEYARRIATLEAEAEEAMIQFTQTKRGRLRIGASSTIAAYLLPQLMCDYRARWPEIELEMSIGNSAQIQQQVLDHVVDIGLVEGAKPDEQLDIKTFRDDQLVPVVPWGHPILSERRPSLKSFAKLPLIMREPGSGTREVIEAFLLEKGYPSAAAFAFGSTEAVKGAVAAGLGVSFISSLAVPGDVMLKRLAVVRLKDAPAIKRPFYNMHAHGKLSNPVVEAFQSILKRR